MLPKCGLYILSVSHIHLIVDMLADVLADQFANEGTDLEIIHEEMAL